jgi:hypothetical protein
MSNLDRFWQDKGTIKLGFTSGLDIQQVLGLRWYPMGQNGIVWKDGDDYVDVSLYYEPYSEPSSYKKINARLLALRKKVVDKKGYFFHISGKKKDYIGFRNIEVKDVASIMYDLMDYFEEESD